VRVQGRAPFAAARALRALGRAPEALQQVAAAEALCWNVALQRWRGELYRETGTAMPARVFSDSSSDEDEEDEDDEDEEEEEDEDDQEQEHAGSAAAAHAASRDAVVALLREAAATSPLPPPPPPPPPPLPPQADGGAAGDAPSSAHACRYIGHRHSATIKDVSFLGDEQQYVASGSDDGRFFVWQRRDGQLLAAPRADGSVVNCVQSAPGGGLRVASCGIDHTVKLWAPTSDGDAALAAAADAADAAAANAARRGAEGGRRALPRNSALTLLQLLRQANGRRTGGALDEEDSGSEGSEGMQSDDG
jgi:hypothetical protein